MGGFSMKWHKERTILISGVCLIVFIIFVYKQFVQVKNIFDHMYYNTVQSSYPFSSFRRMEQIEDVYVDWGSSYAVDGIFDNDYKEEYLREVEQISVVCDRNNSTLEIIVAKQLRGVEIVFRYSYDVKTKQLLENMECLVDEKYYNNSQEVLMITEMAGITEDELLKWRQYLLRDKLLKDWLDVTFSRFSAKRWGRVEFIEVLPLDSK